MVAHESCHFPRAFLYASLYPTASVVDIKQTALLYIEIGVRCEFTSQQAINSKSGSRCRITYNASVVEWSITTDCKSVGFGLRWFESNPAHTSKHKNTPSEEGVFLCLETELLQFRACVRVGDLFLLFLKKKQSRPGRKFL
jgi:hypothetical protein